MRGEKGKRGKSELRATREQKFLMGPFICWNCVQGGEDEKNFAVSRASSSAAAAQK